MPHVIVKLYPGRSDDKKKKLAEAIAKNIADIAVCDDSSISVAFEEVEKEEWPEQVYRPDIIEKQDLLVKKPGYNPFE